MDTDGRLLAANLSAADYRSLVRDYERRADLSEAMIFLAMGNLLVRRISRP